MPASEDVFAFGRQADGAPAIVVAVNTGADPRLVALPGAGVVIASTHRQQEGRRADDHVELPPLGAFWVRLD